MVRSQGYTESSNVLFLKLDVKNLCVLVLYMWHTHGITNINKSIKY